MTLFERTSRSVSVTVIGAEIVSRARHVLEDIEAILSVAQSQSGPLAGGFNLGLISTFGPCLLPWFIPPLKKDYPELRLAVREDLTTSLLDRISSHRLDAALVALPVPDDRLETLPLFGNLLVCRAEGRQADHG